MNINRIKKLKVNSTTFSIKWINDYGGAWFSYGDREIGFNTKSKTDAELLMMICHELMEICAEEMGVRLRRPDCNSDYIFVYDHRQHTTMIEMFSGLIEQFIV